MESKRLPPPPDKRLSDGRLDRPEDFSAGARHFERFKHPLRPQRCDSLHAALRQGPQS
jgi:hypothetical protein